MGLLFLFLFTSLFFSFLCSVLEAVLLSITPSFVSIHLQKGTHFGIDLKRFKDDIDRPLAAILTLNTIAHTVGAAGVGVQASIYLPQYDPIVVSGILTIAILLLSEIIPKTLGANYWEKLAFFSIKTIKIIIWMLLPLVWLSKLLTKVLKREKGKSVLSKADFYAMTDIGTEQGVFRKEESRIIKNLLRFNKTKVTDIMTPRTVVVAVSEDTTIAEFYKDHENLRFSRIPIFRENIDNVTGYALKNDILNAIIKGEGDRVFSEMAREITIVDGNVTIPEMLNTFLNDGEHIAIVADEYGGMDGLVTMEDCMESLIGMEIMDELDNIADMQELAKTNWSQRAKELNVIEQDKDREEDDDDKNLSEIED